MKIISITGKKGKTTITRLVDYLLRNMWFATISVDNDFYTENGEKRFGINDSIQIWGMQYMARCPGRWLWIQNINTKNFDYFIAESASGCYKHGLGYEKHDIGIFTNLDSAEKALSYGNTKPKLANAKGSFIFGSLKKEWVAIFDADNKYILNVLEKFDKDFIKIGIWKNFSMNSYHFFIEYHGTEINIFEKNQKIYSYSFKNAFLTFQNQFLPWKQNIAIALATILAEFWIEKFLKEQDKINALIEDYLPDEQGGRLVIKQLHNSQVIIDYAHDIASISEILKLLKNLNKNYHIFFDFSSNNNKYLDFLLVTKRLKIPSSKITYYKAVNFKNTTENIPTELIEINEISKITKNINPKNVLILSSRHSRDKILEIF